MKKLYTCTIKIEMAVLAETKAEAQKLAHANLHKEAYNMDFVCSLMKRLPSGWDQDCIPYQDGPATQTIREIWKCQTEE
jgi:hypothetical protein